MDAQETIVGPFFAMHAQEGMEENELRNRTKHARLPIVVTFQNKVTAEINGVGQSGREYVMEYETLTVFMGLDHYLKHLADKQPIRTRQTEDRCARQTVLCVDGRMVPSKEWESILLGWAVTDSGAVACVDPAVASFPNGPAIDRPQPQQRRVIYLPEPPMARQAYVDDSDDESMSSGDEAMMPMEDIVEEVVPEVQVECSICYDLLTDENRCAPPCGNPRHTVCHGCLTRHATNWSCHCVSAHSPFVGCPHEGCTHAYRVEDIRLSPQDRTRLVDRIKHFEGRQRTHASCPKCNTVVPIEASTVKDQSPGTVAIECPGCQHRFCYHCLQDALSTEQSGLDGIVCEGCTVHRPPCAGDFNRYVPKKGCVALIPRNYELTVADCMAHLQWLVENQSLPNGCRACGCPMHRTTACAEVVHCGLRQCTVCGMSGLEFETHLIDHWHGEGRFGTCPRWPTDVFWSHTVTAKERCEEGVCHDEHRDCTDPNHADYREQVIEVRRMRHVRCCLASFPHQLQRLVLGEIMRQGGALREMVDRLRFARRVGALV